MKYTLVQDETTGSAAASKGRYRLPGSVYLAEAEADSALRQTRSTALASGDGRHATQQAQAETKPPVH